MFLQKMFFSCTPVFFPSRPHETDDDAGKFLFQNPMASVCFCYWTTAKKHFFVFLVKTVCFPIPGGDSWVVYLAFFSCKLLKYFFPFLKICGLPSSIKTKTPFYQLIGMNIDGLTSRIAGKRWLLPNGCQGNNLKISLVPLGSL